MLNLGSLGFELCLIIDLEFVLLIYHLKVPVIDTLDLFVEDDIGCLFLNLEMVCDFFSFFLMLVMMSFYWFLNSLNLSAVNFLSNFSIPSLFEVTCSDLG